MHKFLRAGLIIAGISLLLCQIEKELPDFDLLWDYNHPNQTEKIFRELLADAENSGNISYQAQLLTQIGRTLGLQRKFDAAHAVLDQAEAMITPDLHVARIRLFLERGRTLNSSGYPDSSKVYFLKSWELCLEHQQDFFGVDAAHMLGIVETPEIQIEWNLKALRLAENSQDPRARGWLGSLYNNIGWTYHDLGEYNTALNFFEEGLEFRQEVGDDYGARIAKWTVARTYRSLGKIEEALGLQMELLEEIEEQGLDPDGYVFEELGENLLLLDRGQEAKPYFKLAYDLLSRDPWLQQNVPDRLSRLKELGE